jgi:hypothetical protein
VVILAGTAVAVAGNWLAGSSSFPEKKKKKSSLSNVNHYHLPIPLKLHPINGNHRYRRCYFRRIRFMGSPHRRRPPEARPAAPSAILRHKA